MKLLKTLGTAIVASLAIGSTANAACLNFFQHVPGGPYAGGVYQLDPNTQIVVKQTAFWGPHGAPAPRFGGIEFDKNKCFGGPASLVINNASLAIHIIQKEPNAKVVNFNYCDLGGYENVGADLSAPPSYIGEITHTPGSLPDPFGGSVKVTVKEGPIPGGKEGKLIFEATSLPIAYMEVGGQEFFGHSICVN